MAFAVKEGTICDNVARRSGLPEAALSASELSIWIGAGLSAAFWPLCRVPVTMTSSSPPASADASDVAVAVLASAIVECNAIAPAHSAAIATRKSTDFVSVKLKDM
jgi:hypothetical protein